MKGWPLTEEQFSTFSELVYNAWQKKEEENNKKRMRWTRMYKFLKYLHNKGAKKYQIPKSEMMQYHVAFWDCDFEEMDKMIKSGATGSALVIEADPQPWVLEWLWRVLKQKSVTIQKIGVYYRKKCS